MYIERWKLATDGVENGQHLEGKNVNYLRSDTNTCFLRGVGPG